MAMLKTMTKEAGEPKGSPAGKADYRWAKSIVSAPNPT